MHSLSCGWRHDMRHSLRDPRGRYAAVEDGYAIMKPAKDACQAEFGFPKSKEKRPDWRRFSKPSKR